MSYKSPIRVLARFADQDDALDLQNLLKIQKRVLLELELGGKPYLIIEEGELTKDDIISLFDQLKEEKNLFYHQLIFSNKNLLNLLEKGSCFNQPLFDPNIVHRKEFQNFKAFVSPLLIEPLGKELNKAFNVRDFVKGRKLLQGIRLINEVDFDRVFHRLKSSVLLLVSEIDLVVDKANPHQNIDRFRFIPNNDFILFLNELPDELEKLRNELATSLIDLTLMIQQGQTRFVYLIYLSLKALNCRADIKKIIEENARATASWNNKVNSITAWDEIILEEQESKNTFAGTSLIPALLAAIFIILFVVVITFPKKSTHSPLERFGIAQTTVSTKDPEDKYFKDHLRKVSLRFMKDGYSQHLKSDPFMADFSDSRIYPQKYGALQRYTTGNIALSLSNSSAYDAVVFLKTDRHSYTAYLGKNKELVFKVNEGDIISFYPGNSWDPEGRISLSDYRLKEVKHEIKGYFQIADSATLDYLNKRFVILCPQVNCDNIKLSIASDENGKFLFEKKYFTVEVEGAW